MGLFNSILSKLGIGKADATETGTETGQKAAATASGSAAGVAEAVAPAAAISGVDVAAQMEQRAAANPQKLNWRVSIVDLLKLLELDSSYGARKEMAAELHCPPEQMKDSAKMNVWLHKTVLARIAENGGKVPHELLS